MAGAEDVRGRAAPASAPSAANAARDLQNLPANVATPTFLAERAARDRRRVRGARGRGARPRRDRRATGWARFAAVAQGSVTEPRLIVLRYRPPGAAGPHLGLRRQGRDVRHRRDLDQARGQDAGDEVRHVGRGRRDRGDGGDRQARAAGHRSPRSCPPPRTCRAAAPIKPGDIVTAHERQDDRGEQHRRRGPPDPRRRARLRGRAGRRADRGPGHAHRRDPVRARPHLRRAVVERRRLVRRRSRAPATPPASWAGGCRCTPSTSS